MEKCQLKEQGWLPGSCATSSQQGTRPACQVALKWEDGRPYRLIKSAHLSRPEHYFSIYQSGCNFSCLKCHSWEFTQHVEGKWLSPQDIVTLAREYATQVTLWEPRERATSFHGLELCQGCGACIRIKLIPVVKEGKEVYRVVAIPTGKHSPLCPGKLSPEQMVFSPQGWGPARNIIAFTGGDIMCQPEFYLRCTEGIKELDKGLWVLLETNGYGLTPQNLSLYRNAGIDAFWLDIKAYDRETHKKLTGVDNEWILKLPEEILKWGFTLEVLSLYIPGWVEIDQIGKIAHLLVEVDAHLPFTILAFFPTYKLRDVSSPTLDQMLAAYEVAKAAGLKRVRLGNIGVFVKDEEEMERLLTIAREAI